MWSFSSSSWTWHGATGEVVRDGATGQVTRHKDQTKIHGLGDPRVPSGLLRLRNQPQDRRRGIVDGGREDCDVIEAYEQRHDKLRRRPWLVPFALSARLKGV